jgi:phosphate-selective porin
VRRWTASVTGSSLLLILLVSGARASLGDGAVETTATAAEPDPAGESPAAVEISAGPGGFVLRSSGGDFTLRLRSLVQMDGRFYTGDGPSSDGFLVRRARLELVGTLFGRFDFRLMPDFAGSATTLLDAWVRWKMSPAFQVQVGKVKLPVGLERAQSREFNSCNEFGYPTSLVPNRDIGANIQGELVDGSLAYYLGVFDGTGDGGSASADTDGDRELAARLFAIPFKGDGESWLGKTPGCADSLSDGRPADLLPLVRRGRYRWDHLAGRASAVLLPGTVWSALGICGLLTGGPQRRADERDRESGVDRERVLGADRRRRELRRCDPRSRDRQAGRWFRRLGAVVNWYLNPMFRVSVDYSHTDLEGGPLASEDVIIARMQLRF